MAMAMAAMRLLRGSARPARPLALLIPRLHSPHTTPSSHTHLSSNSSKPDPKSNSSKPDPKSNSSKPHAKSIPDLKSKFDPFLQTFKNFKVPKPNINLDELSKAMIEVFESFHNYVPKGMKDFSWALKKMELLMDMMPPHLKEQLKKELLDLPYDAYKELKSHLISKGFTKLIQLLGARDHKGPVVILKTADPIDIEGLLKSLNAKTVLIIPISEDLDYNTFKVKSNGASKTSGGSAKSNGGSNTNGAAGSTKGAAKTNGGSAKTNGGSAKTNGGSAKTNGGKTS